MNGIEADSDAEWLVGTDPQREAMAADTEVLGESSKAPGKQEREPGQCQSLWDFQGFSMDILLDQMSTFMAGSLQGTSDFLLSWEEAANKKEGELLCTNVTTLGEHREIWGRKHVEVRAFVLQLLKKSWPYCDLVQEIPDY